MEADCLLWGMKFVVPEKQWKRVLNELHLTHSGMSQMKAIAMCGALGWKKLSRTW